MLSACLRALCFVVSPTGVADLGPPRGRMGVGPIRPPQPPQQVADEGPAPSRNLRAVQRRPKYVVFSNSKRCHQCPCACKQFARERTEWDTTVTPLHQGQRRAKFFTRTVRHKLFFGFMPSRRRHTPPFHTTFRCLSVCVTGKDARRVVRNSSSRRSSFGCIVTFI